MSPDKKPKSNPNYPFLFCIYCQRQFKSSTWFRRHILNRHGEGLARKLGLRK